MKKLPEVLYWAVILVTTLAVNHLGVPIAGVALRIAILAMGHVTRAVSTRNVVSAGPVSSLASSNVPALLYGLSVVGGFIYTNNVYLLAGGVALGLWILARRRK